jgi:hypothetical protein
MIKDCIVKDQPRYNQPYGTSDLAKSPTPSGDIGLGAVLRLNRIVTIATLTTTLGFDAGDIRRGPVKSSAARILCSLFMVVLVWFSSSQLSAQEIIVNADVRTDSLSRNEARLFFTMRLQGWPDKRPVKVFVLPDDNPLHSAFAKTILGLFPYQLRRVWDRQLFSGTGQVPTTVASEEDMLRHVAATPGAIGYLSRIPRDARVRSIEVR